jgi:DNA-binding transcriptional ArsR family regulator
MPKPLRPQDLSDEALSLIAAQFKLLSEPTRLKLLVALQGGEKNVSELVAETGMNQANISRHLQGLVDAGVAARRKEGVKAYFSIADKGIFELCHCVCGSLQKRLERKSKEAALFSA